jgi:hypothetical protein
MSAKAKILGGCYAARGGAGGSPQPHFNSDGRDWT